MAEIVRMPLMSDTMTEGVIVEWHKKVGDAVESGDLLAEIETDKATMEFEAPEDGVLVYHAEAGQAIAINALLAIIIEEGEEIDVDAIVAQEKEDTSDNVTSDTSSNGQSEVVKSVDSQIDIAAPVLEAVTTSISPSNQGRLKASPLAKRLAKENNIDIAILKGTGDEGRIIKRDVENFVAQRQTAPTAVVSTPQKTVAHVSSADSAVNYEEVRVSQMRKTIARRLGESKFSAPHFYLKIEVLMDKMMETRKNMNEFAPSKISFNDLIVKAVAMSLRQHQAVNSSWMGDTIRQNKDINIGIAVAVEDGLLVPVIHAADNKSLSQIGSETRVLAQKAKEKKLQPNEMQGNTFTISNLGMFGIDEFTAIINPPDACILAVGTIAAVPAVVDGEIKVVNKMKLTLSCDHRVVDGATGAKFLKTLKDLLENPIGMLV